MKTKNIKNTGLQKVKNFFKHLIEKLKTTAKNVSIFLKKEKVRIKRTVNLIFLIVVILATIGEIYFYISTSQNGEIKNFILLLLELGVIFILSKIFEKITHIQIDLSKLEIKKENNILNILEDNMIKRLTIIRKVSKITTLIILSFSAIINIILNLKIIKLLPNYDKIFFVLFLICLPILIYKLAEDTNKKRADISFILHPQK